MADLDETMIYEVVPTERTGWGMYTAVLDTNDTITLGNFSVIIHSFGILAEDLSEVTTVNATNTVQVTTAAISDEKVIIWVYGM